MRNREVNKTQPVGWRAFVIRYAARAPSERNATVKFRKKTFGSRFVLFLNVSALFVVNSEWRFWRFYLCFFFCGVLLFCLFDSWRKWREVADNHVFATLWHSWHVYGNCILMCEAVDFVLVLKITVGKQMLFF